MDEPRQTVYDYNDNQPDERDLGERTVELLSKVINYVVKIKIDALIKVMLEQLNQDRSLSKQTVGSINTKAIEEMDALVSGLLQAAFMTQEVDWLNCLGLSESQVTDKDLEQFCLVTEALNEIFDASNFDD